MAVSELQDSEFGAIQVHRVRGRSSIGLKVTPAGVLRITMPPLTPLIMAKRLLESSRPSIRKLLQTNTKTEFYDGMQLGKSHTLQTRNGAAFTIKRTDRVLLVTLPDGVKLESQHVQSAVRAEVIRILRREAKHYLPKRLQHLAKQHGYSYATLRFSHASSRWGSCSSNGTISLNIALMKLPFELIDYVLVHELCHTKQMNHSPVFWELVAAADPRFKQHRKLLKAHTPAI